MGVFLHSGKGRAGLLASACLLAGCATLPAPGDRPAPAPVENFATSQSFSGQSLSAQAAQWPADQWWTGYGDPQLSALIEEGLKGATDLKVAEARFAQAQAIAGAANGRLLPSLGAQAEGGIAKQSYNYLLPRAVAPRGWPDYAQGAVRLDWDPDFWGGNRAALAAARLDAAAAGAEAAAARLAVASGVAAAYADFAGLHAEQDAARRAVDVRSKTLELMQARQGQGLENEGAVQRARSALAAAQGELAALDEAVALTRNRIAALVGAGPDRGLALTRPASEATGSAATGAFGLPENLPAQLIGRRPDLVSARLRAEAAASRIGAARAAFYPNVNLSAMIGLQALGVENLFKTGASFGAVGPAISLPIFNGGQLRGRYRAAEAEYRVAVAQYDGVLTQSLREIADVAASQRALQQRLDTAQQAERAAQIAWTVASDRYRGGLASYLDVLTAEDALIAASRVVASLQNRAFALDVALVRALGGGFRS